MSLQVLLVTSEMSREELTRRSSSKKLELRLSSKQLTKTTLFQLDLLSMILTSRILKKIHLKLLNLEKLSEKNSAKSSLRLIETYQTQRLTKRHTMLDSFSADYVSEWCLPIFKLYKLLKKAYLH